MSNDREAFARTVGKIVESLASIGKRALETEEDNRTTLKRFEGFEGPVVAETPARYATDISKDIQTLSAALLSLFESIKDGQEKSAAEKADDQKRSNLLTAIHLILTAIAVGVAAYSYF